MPFSSLVAPKPRRRRVAARTRPESASAKRPWSPKTRVGNFLRKCPNRVGENDAQAANARRVAESETEKSVSGVRYYGRRYFDPQDGRFVGRDPIGEMGGMNLYAFVRNRPVNRWDYAGMTGWGLWDYDEFDYQEDQRSSSSGRDSRGNLNGGVGSSNAPGLSGGRTVGGTRYVVMGNTNNIDLGKASNSTLNGLGVSRINLATGTDQNGRGFTVVGSRESGGITIGDSNDNIVYQAAEDTVTGDWINVAGPTSEFGADVLVLNTKRETRNPGSYRGVGKSGLRQMAFDDTAKINAVGKIAKSVSRGNLMIGAAQIYTAPNENARMDAIASVGGGTAGTFIGGAIGTFTLGPGHGTAIGGLVGGVVGSQANYPEEEVELAREYIYEHLDEAFEPIDSGEVFDAIRGID